ncbi:MAG: UvrD-helicase domain-containing protein [Desulfobulbus sp.]|nr:UvrD-helicase domain-containing protein [Desulfobulbus sp.]
MNYIADLHVHSHYSRATSKASNLYGLAAWAAVKGISVVGTGDFTHPGWFAHLYECLEPAEPGFFRLKADPAGELGDLLPQGIRPAMELTAIRFVLSAEISSIYKRGGKVRKVHNLLYVPDFDAARRLNTTLATLGNIAADGRPILGLDSRDLLEILLEKAHQGFLVPAHIWTPWFSLFGSKSGFDSIEECFGALSPHIFALETGLSSDPEMNRLISALDRFTLISNSDCHSPAKLGREANIFTTGFDYFSMREAIRMPVNEAGQQVFAATVEFYPEEGKYHCDGHRTCQVCLQPHATRASGGLCPVCGKPLTIGVLHRVMELADREQPVLPPGSPQVHSLVPLAEIVAELLDCGPASKKVMEGYIRLINIFGSEFGLLLKTPVEAIQAKGSALLAEAIERVRSNRVIRKPGYDGEFGVITVFSEGERAELCGQSSLFGPVAGPSQNMGKKRQRLGQREEKQDAGTRPTLKQLNSEQQQAVDSAAALILVQAGPGTGKTNTLVSRVRRLSAQVEQACTVITFTNKAAEEVRERLQNSGAARGAVTVATFHGYCLAQLRRCTPGLQVAGPEERAALIEEIFPGWNAKKRERFSRDLGDLFCRSNPGEHTAETHRYLAALVERSLIDIEAVVPRTVEMLRQDGEEAAAIRGATGRHLLVDEFQDVNEAQYALVALLAQTSTVFAIGDPDQAIYGFRGSDPQWLYAFIREMHPEVHSLVRNYRSAPVIVGAAAQLISHNVHSLPPASMQAHVSRQGTIQRQECAAPDQEARFIADQIEIRLGGTSHRSLKRFDHTGGAAVGLRDIGILYRIGRQAETIGKVLTERGIPFQLVDLEAYYIRGECRLLYCWLLLLANRAEPEHLLALVRREQGIDEQAVRMVRLVLCQMVRQRENEFGAMPLLGGPIDAVLAPFHQMLARMRALSATAPAAEVLVALCARYGFDPEQPDVKRLRELALSFGSLADFASHLHRFSDSVLYDPRAEAVTLSTLHAAKGLEFPVVFIAGCEEGLLPLAPHVSESPETQRRQLEEERRLFYVGVTRTTTNLICTWCRSRALYGTPVESRQPSRFLDELPADAFSPILQPRAQRKKPAVRQLSLFS